MVKIFLSIDTSSVSRKFDCIAKNCKKEIVKISAIACDEDLVELDTFNCSIRPEFVNTLKGIPRQFFDNLHKLESDYFTFEEAWEAFSNWCSSFDELEIYTFDEKDLSQVISEMKVKDIDPDSFTTDCFTSWYTFRRINPESFGITYEQMSRYAFQVEGTIYIEGEDVSEEYARGLVDLYNVCFEEELLGTINPAYKTSKNRSDSSDRTEVIPLDEIYIA